MDINKSTIYVEHLAIESADLFKSLFLSVPKTDTLHQQNSVVMWAPIYWIQLKMYGHKKVTFQQSQCTITFQVTDSNRFSNYGIVIFTVYSDKDL